MKNAPKREVRKFRGLVANKQCCTEIILTQNQYLVGDFRLVHPRDLTADPHQHKLYHLLCEKKTEKKNLTRKDEKKDNKRYERKIKMETSRVSQCVEVSMCRCLIEKMWHSAENEELEVYYC